MKYVRKICPVCGNQFVVLESMKEKAVYCTIKCFMESQDQTNNEEISPLPSS